MHRPLLSFLCAALVCNLSAQLWCGPGAQWNYTVQAFATGGSIVRTYMGDSLFEGASAQHIHESGQLIQYWGAQDTISLDRDRFTTLVDSTLLLWTDVSGAGQWDTLHRFNAMIGDRWFPPGADSICGQGYMGMLIVTDTGTTIIDGVQLRTWDLSYCDVLGQPNWAAFEVLERLGPMNGLEILPGGCIIVEYGEVLSCYTDAQISYNETAWPYGCSSITNVSEERNAEGIVVAPNPGNDRFDVIVALPVQGASLLVLDATGREALRLPIREQRTNVNAEALPPGMFILRMIDRAGSVIGQEIWVKQ